MHTLVEHNHPLQIQDVSSVTGDSSSNHLSEKSILVSKFAGLNWFSVFDKTFHNIHTKLASQLFGLNSWILTTTFVQYMFNLDIDEQPSKSNNNKKNI